MNRFGIDKEPRTLEDFQRAWPKAMRLLEAIYQSPDVVAGDRSFRLIPGGLSIPDDEIRQPTAATSTPGAFFRTFTADDTHWLQGGQVMGGDGNETVPDIALAAVGAEPSDGYLHWLEITGDGVTDSGILLPGYNVSSATDDDGASLPDNTLPTASSATGRKVHVLLGSWSGGSFFPSQSGNVAVTFCLGGYTVDRG